MRLVLFALFLPQLGIATERPLQLLPAEKLIPLAPTLRQSEVALIESLPDGKMRQVTIFTLVAAPPAVVRDVLLNPERYPEFMRNLTESKVTRHSDGTIVQDFYLDFKITHLVGTSRYRTNSDGSVDVKAIDPNDDGVYRWEFYPVPGGTVMVLYGYTDVLHSNGFVRSITDRMPSMEHALGLATQLVYTRSIRDRAQQLAKPGSFLPPDLKAKSPGLDFLLKRGRVALMRSHADGSLSDISVIDHIYAPRSRVIDALLHPAAYPKFIDGVKSCEEMARGEHELTYHIENDISVLRWDSRFALRSDERGIVDAYGTSGDLEGAHYRWDLTSVSERDTLAVFRARIDLRAASPLVLGILFRVEPRFEHGLAVSVGLVQMNGVRGRAEGWR